jgi:hypothetical protein
MPDRPQKITFAEMRDMGVRVLSGARQEMSLYQAFRGPRD